MREPVTVKLTKKQLEQFIPVFTEVDAAFERNEKGMAIAQIRSAKNTEYAGTVQAMFIPGETALQIMDLIRPHMKYSLIRGRI